MNRKFEFVNRVLKADDDDFEGAVCMKLPERGTKKSARL